MKSNKYRILEEAVGWFKKAGFESDFSLFVAGILDIGDGVDDIVTHTLPLLLETTPDRFEEILAVIEDLHRQLEHIAQHAQELKSFGNKALEYFDAD